MAAKLVRLLGLVLWIELGASNGFADGITISELTFTPDVVDVSLAAQTTTLKFRAQSDSPLPDFVPFLDFDQVLQPGDEFSGFISLSSCPSTTDLTRISGDDLDGVYEANMTIPPGTPKGFWVLLFLFPPGQYCFIPSPPERLAIHNDGDIDRDPPELLSWTTPASVDVTDGDVAVEMTFEFFDTVGVVQPDLVLRSNLGGFFEPEAPLVRSGGSETNPQFTGTFVVPEYSRPAIWELSGYAFDRLGNLLSMGPERENGTLTVINNGTADVTPPILTSISMSPEVVDVTDGDQRISIQVEASDDQSGVLGAASYQQFFPHRRGLNYIENRPFEFIPSDDSTPLNWAGTGSLNIPQRTSSGDVRIECLIFDRAGNFSKLIPGVKTVPIPPALPQAIRVASSAPDFLEAVEASLPILDSLSISQGVIDVADGAVTVEITARLRDAHSGVDRVEINPSFGGRVSLELTSGDDRDGEWSISLEVPREVTSLSFESYLSLTAVDKLQNEQQWTTADQSIGFPDVARFPFPVEFQILNQRLVQRLTTELVSATSPSLVVDVSGSEQEIVVEVQLSKDVTKVAVALEPIDYATAGSRRAPVGEQTVPVASGKFLVPILLPAHTVTGKYQLRITARNSKGAAQIYRAAQFPIGSTRAIHVVNETVPLSTIPTLVDLSLSENDLLLATEKQIEIIAEFSAEAESFPSVTFSMSFGANARAVNAFGRLWTQLERDANSPTPIFRGTLLVPKSLPQGSYPIELALVNFDRFPVARYGAPNALSFPRPYPDDTGTATVINRTPVFASHYSPFNPNITPIFDGDQNANFLPDVIDTVMGNSTQTSGTRREPPALAASPLDGLPALRFPVDPLFDIEQVDGARLDFGDGNPNAPKIGLAAEITTDAENWNPGTIREIADHWYELPMTAEAGKGIVRMRATEIDKE